MINEFFNKKVLILTDLLLITYY